MGGKKVQKSISFLPWIEEELPSNTIRKPMFGGYAFYLDNKMVLAVFDSPGDRKYKNITYDFDLWSGCLFPTEREHHKAILELFPQLFSHPVLGKWLYLPEQTESFEDIVTEIIKHIAKRSPLFGILPKEKGKKISAKKSHQSLSKKESQSRKNLNKKSKIEDSTDDKIDTRKPRMFSDDSSEIVLEKAIKISDLKNLGPSSEKEFSKAGIKTAKQFIKMGWQKAYEKLVKVNPKNRHTVFAYALIGAINNKPWFKLSEEEKKQAKEFTFFLKKKKFKSSK